MAILIGPHQNLPENELSRAQAEISTKTKLIVDGCTPDRGIHYLIIQHAYQNVADFILANNLTYLDHERIYTFIRSGFRELPDPRVVGTPTHGRDGGANSRTDETTPPAKNVRTRTKKSVGLRGA